MDFAKRAHDHNYRLDPIVRNRTDKDFYKLSMGAVIHERHPGVQVAFQLTNRSTDVRLADHVSLAEMREQLDHASSLRYTPTEIVQIRGQSYYGEQGLFKDPFVNRLAQSRLPEYELTVDEATGQFVLRSQGDWIDVTDWEIHFMTIVNELFVRAQLRTMSYAEIDMMYARAKVRLYAKLERIRDEAPGLTISEFGTRRRHSFLWQRWVLETMRDVLGKQFVGTSNVLHSMQLGMEAKGTIAHEMPMVYAALAAGNGPEAIRHSQYRVMQDIRSILPERLHVMLPDTFGSTQYLRCAPAWMKCAAGARPDSKPAVEAAEEMIRFWERVGEDPKTKLLILSDGLDVTLPGEKPNGEDMIAIHDAIDGRIADTYGWGTNATNGFRGLVPGRPDAMRPISIVAKAVEANGRPTVKISDNPAKASSLDPAELDLYRRTFGVEGVGENRATLV